jgi:hypothetical protein
VRHFKTPPSAESGREYKTVEERCAACEVNGGDEGMCIKQRESDKWQREHGRPCPRVELDPRNHEAMQLLGWAIHDDLKPLASNYGRALLAGYRAEERAAILARIGYALRDVEVMKVLHPEAQKDE